MTSTSEKFSTAYVVVGSGPSGCACAQGLLDSGAQVILIDAGIALEPQRAEMVARMAAVPHSSWTRSQIDQLTTGTVVQSKGIPEKLLSYGSDFAYRDCKEYLDLQADGVALKPSLAQGGFSNVWGGAMLPYIEKDISDWPIRVEKLAPHYLAAAQMTGMSAVADDLQQFFPLYHNAPGHLEASAQAKVLLATLQSNRDALAKEGIYFGRSRLAVQGASSTENGCVYCGLCRYGCPYGYIYNAADTLKKLQANPRFDYRQNIIVTAVDESEGNVCVKGYHRIDKAPFQLECARIFLAGGVIPTTQILLRSLRLYEQQASVKDSQYFMLPLVLPRSITNVASEPVNTLSQIFLEIFDDDISKHAVHLQLYSYNDLIGKAVREKFGFLARPLEFLARDLEGRLMVALGYLHSKHSGRVTALLKKNGDGGDRFFLSSDPNEASRAVVAKVVKKMMRHTVALGALPGFPAVQIPAPGHGFHAGGTFPMSVAPGEMQSDVLGRPQGLRRVHAVDATVFPSIPATTITFSVMANAHRIACEAVKLA